MRVLLEIRRKMSRKKRGTEIKDKEREERERMILRGGR